MVGERPLKLDRARSFTLDGEAVVCGADGVAVFDALARRHEGPPTRSCLDLLELNGKDLRPMPLERAQRQAGPAAGAGVYWHRLQRTPTKMVPWYSVRLQDGVGGYRVEAAQRAIPVRTVTGLDQGEEPNSPAGAGRW
jgi:hypothetical protein